MGKAGSSSGLHHVDSASSMSSVVAAYDKDGKVAKTVRKR